MVFKETIRQRESKKLFFMYDTKVENSGTSKALGEKYEIAVLGHIPIDPEFGFALDSGEDFIKKFDKSNTADSIRNIIGAISSLINL